MTALEVLVAAAAVWRVSALVCYERGPFDVFTKMRERLGFTHDDDGMPLTWPDRWPANMLACVWCTSVNVAIPVALLWLAWPAGAFWLSLPLALSAVAVVIERYAHG